MAGSALQQPVQGGVELVLIDLAEIKARAKAGGGAAGESARARPAGMRVRGPADQECKNEIAAAIVVGAKDPIEPDPAGGAESGGDVAVRQGADDGEGFAPGRDDSAASEHAAQTFDVGGGPVREVAEGTFTDLSTLAIAFAQQDGRGRVPVGDGFDIHGGV